MQFSQVIGQKEIKAQLIHMIQQNRLSHAQLLLGKEGSGALSLARAFAQYTVCEKVNGKTSISQKPVSSDDPSLFGDPEPKAEPLEEPRNEKKELFNDSCGECLACKKASQLRH